MRPRFLLLVLALGSFLPQCAHASPVNSLTYQYTTDSPTYSDIPGNTVHVSIYLVETLVTGNSSLLVGDKGLNSAGAAFTRLSGTATLKDNSFAYNTTDFPGLSSLNRASDGSSLDFLESVSISNTTGGPTGSPTGVGTDPRRELLGTVDITLPSTPNTTTQFQLAHRLISGQPGSSTLLFAHPTYDIDLGGTTKVAADGGTYSWTAATGQTFTVTTTPEPSALALLLLPGLLLLRRQRCA